MQAFLNSEDTVLDTLIPRISDSHNPNFDEWLHCRNPHQMHDFEDIPTQVSQNCNILKHEWRRSRKLRDEWPPIDGSGGSVGLWYSCLWLRWIRMFQWISDREVNLFEYCGHLHVCQGRTPLRRWGHHSLRIQHGHRRLHSSRFDSTTCEFGNLGIFSLSSLFSARRIDPRFTLHFSPGIPSFSVW